jgi:uncharacterized protein (TIGR00297 family)
VLAGAVALAAWRARALTFDGALAAWFVGAAVFASGSWPFAAVLFAFFIPAVALSRSGKQRKVALVDVDKRGARDARQVFANGGIATACAIGYAFTHSPVLAAAFAGAFAAAAADTWGTELGTLARALPRSIIGLQTIPRGLSGGVTLAGTLAEIGGAVSVGLIAYAVGIAPPWMIAAAGFAGALADSILGASVQALLYCVRCQRRCETDPHECGNATSLVRGVRWIDNDAVNALATLAGALGAGSLAAVYLTAF